MKKLFLCAFLMIMFSFFSFAQTQIPDILIYDNKVYDLYSYPLNDYLKTQSELPRLYVRPDIGSSANLRGYVALWEITDGNLFLRGIDAWRCGKNVATQKRICEKIDIKEMFGGKYQAGKVFASWFTGELRIPGEDKLEPVDLRYKGSIYKQDKVLKIEAGKVVSEVVVDNSDQERPSNSDLLWREIEKLKKPVKSNEPMQPKKNI